MCISVLYFIHEGAFCLKAMTGRKSFSSSEGNCEYLYLLYRGTCPLNQDTGIASEENVNQPLVSVPFAGVLLSVDPEKLFL